MIPALVGRGIGFGVGVKYVPTLGLSVGAAPPAPQGRPLFLRGLYASLFTLRGLYAPIFTLRGG